MSKEKLKEWLYLLDTLKRKNWSKRKEIFRKGVIKK
jgi:hypothetical protein